MSEQKVTEETVHVNQAVEGDESTKPDSDYAYSQHERRKARKLKRKRLSSIRNRPEWTQRFGARNYDDTRDKKLSQKGQQWKPDHDSTFGNNSSRKSEHGEEQNADEINEHDYEMDESWSQSVDLRLQLPAISARDDDASAHGGDTNRLSIPELLDIKPHGQGVYVVPPFTVSRNSKAKKNTENRSNGFSDMVRHMNLAIFQLHCGS